MKNEDTMYAALLARDYRFDGKFFVGVKTTGVYCRPICPARPLRKNVEFFKTALAAERAGYRPCQRCRPEAAPGSPAWRGASGLVNRALRLLAGSGFRQMDEDTFAAGFGVSARHLRRQFQAELGRTPKQIADAHRLNFARTLVVETRLPLTTVALTAGFASLRRFNDAFVKRFATAPSRMRRADLPGQDGALRLTLAYRPPYDFAALLGFYARHAIPGVEHVSGESYERVTRGGHVSLRQHPSRHALELTVSKADPAALFEIARRMRAMFDLDADPLLVANAFADVPILCDLHGKRPGLRMPRGYDAFETAVCAILGQLVAVSYARVLAGQLIACAGETVVHPLTGEKVKLFPSPEVLAKADLGPVGTTTARKKAIRHFAVAVAEGRLSLSGAQDPAEFRKALLAIPGIGPWTAEYIALRGIADTDAFPATDLILKRALEMHPGLTVDACKPWRAYAAIHLWEEFAGRLSKAKRGSGTKETV